MLECQQIIHHINQHVDNTHCVVRAELELLDANGGDQVVREGVAGGLQVDLTHQVNHVVISPGHLLLSDE